MKRNVSVVRFKFRCKILISGKIIEELPGSVASGTPCTISRNAGTKFPVSVRLIFKEYSITFAKLDQHLIIIIIIIFIYCNWVVTRWQWLFYIYTKHEIGYC